MKNLIAERADKIDASGIRKVFALAASLKDPINFSIGQPDFDVPEELKEQAIRAIVEGQNKYSQTAGDMTLKNRITEQMKGEFGWELATPTTIKSPELVSLTHMPASSREAGPE